MKCFTKHLASEKKIRSRKSRLCLLASIFRQKVFSNASLGPRCFFRLVQPFLDSAFVVFSVFNPLLKSCWLLLTITVLTLSLLVDLLFMKSWKMSHLLTLITFLLSVTNTAIGGNYCRSLPNIYTVPYRSLLCSNGHCAMVMSVHKLLLVALAIADLTVTSHVLNMRVWCSSNRKLHSSVQLAWSEMPSQLNMINRALW